MVLIDSYSESNEDSSYNLTAASRHVVQMIRIPTGTDYYLTSLKLWLKYTTSSSFTYAYVLFATDTGTYGDTMKPTGSALETTSSAAGSTLSTSYALKELNFAGTTILYGGEEYALGIKTDTYTSGTLNVGLDGASGTHGGECAYSANGTSWGIYNEDLPFYLYGTVVVYDGSVKKTVPTALIATTTGVNNAQ